MNRNNLALGGARPPDAPDIRPEAGHHRAYLSELHAYAMLAEAGIAPPRHGTVGGHLPFEPGEPVVLKGLGDEVWHKSELGCVRFLEFDAGTVLAEAEAMRGRVEAAGYRWLEGLVCERIRVSRNGDLPVEGFVSLTHGEAGWVALFGFGGLQAEAMAELAPPCRWPIPVMSPAQAMIELEAHLLGRIWLGRVRGTKPLTTRPILRQFLDSLWRLAERLGRDGISLLELNPVALDPAGRPRPLDAVGRFSPPPEAHAPPPDGFLSALTAPQRIALAGVSAQPGGVGRTILDNLRRYNLPAGNLLLVKPGQTEFLGLPCVADVGALLAAPVDLLILALPAAAAADTLRAILRQGGGARVVALVSGGIGDGADKTGLGDALRRELDTARAAGRWTPAVLGPNFLGHWVPSRGLDTSFIPVDKLAAPAGPAGDLTLLSQSGAFLLSRRSRQPRLAFNLGLALGNQMDASLAHVLEALAKEARPGPVAAYVEGFCPGQLTAVASAVARLTAKGSRVLFHRAGRTAEGQAAAASHTGAMAGDLLLERTLLERSGACFADSIAAFDSALAWLSGSPRLRPGSVALLTNAGFESVNGSDHFGAHLTGAVLDEEARHELEALLAAEKLDGLVAPRLPLDLTPMASESAYLAATDIALRQSAAVVVGIVPFTRRLDSSAAGAARFADTLATLARQHSRPLGVVIDAGADYATYREAFVAAGLPVFDRMELALAGLRCLF